MVKRARVIYNPSAGREAVKRVLPEILDVYEEAGYETSAFQTTAEPFSALKEAKRCAEERFDLVVAAGGDGTIHEVMSGIAEKKFRPTVAIIPAGTTNDYARVLKIPRDNLIEAAKLIHNQESLYMDIGKVVTEEKQGYFMNIGALGNLAELTFEVAPQLKTLFGYLAYVVKGAELLPQVRAVPVRIDYDGGSYEGNASLIFIALSDTVGGFTNIVPDKVLGDGNLSLIIIETSNVLELMQLARKLLTDGTHLDSPNVIYKQTPFVDIDVLDDSPLMVNLDGEYGGNAPVHFENLNNHIEVIANVEKMDVEIDDLSELKRAEMKSIFSQEITSYDELIAKREEERKKATDKVE
jgi:diacylglycerol kinase (ATP)